MTGLLCLIVWTGALINPLEDVQLVLMRQIYVFVFKSVFYHLLFSYFPISVKSGVFFI